MAAILGRTGRLCACRQGLEAKLAMLEEERELLRAAAHQLAAHQLTIRLL